MPQLQPQQQGGDRTTPTNHGHKGLFQNTCREVAVEPAPAVPESLEGNGLLQRGQLERYQQDKVLAKG